MVIIFLNKNKLSRGIHQRNVTKLFKKGTETLNRKLFAI